MSRTVTALYDTRAEAEAARDRLASAVDLGAARIIGHAGELDGIHMSADDRHVYREGIRRGAFVLSAEVLGHEQADKIIRIIEETASFDVDARQEQWRRDGWSTPPMTGGASGHASMPGDGRRETGRGGARVRSYLRETPADFAVEVREQQSTSARRPVEQPLSSHTLQTGGAAASHAAPAGGHELTSLAPHRSRPSEAVVIGSAIVGAVVGGVIGGVIPFILAEEAHNADRNRERSPSSRRPHAAHPTASSGAKRPSPW